MATPKSSSMDAKSIAAIAALLTALAGGVELRVQVGLMAARLDRIEAELRGSQVATASLEGISSKLELKRVRELSGGALSGGFGNGAE